MSIAFRLGIDQLILSPNFGSDPQRTCDALQHFAQDVMPFSTGSSPTRTDAAL